jgi:hypothetical protein
MYLSSLSQGLSQFIIYLHIILIEFSCFICSLAFKLEIYSALLEYCSALANPQSPLVPAPLNPLLLVYPLKHLHLPDDRLQTPLLEHSTLSFVPGVVSLTTSTGPPVPVAVMAGRFPKSLVKVIEMPTAAAAQAAVEVAPVPMVAMDTLTLPIVSIASSAAFTVAAVAPNAIEDVVAPLNVKVNVPAVAVQDTL